ncbi:MAG: diacylglycerol kinase family lipid kinase [Rhizobiales bacterium]|nr:diacylglycerol kinase family lipid kinase [Hyphomicrobiales bacterium]
MRFQGVLNRGGGTLRTMDVEAFADAARRTLEAAGHQARFRLVEGDAVADALAEAAQAPDIDVVMAGGGDGTISSAAAALMGSGKALAILPAGTMNLFARGLGIPLDLEAAVAAFAAGKARAVDIATANGRPFVHQFSVGMHSELIRRREEMNYSSRPGKIRASMVAAVATVVQPPRIRFRLELPSAEIATVASSLSVSNNVFGDGPLPVAARPDGGELGVYIARAHRGGEILRILLSIATGRWKQDSAIEMHTAPRVVLRVDRAARGFQCAMDGELLPLEASTEIVIHPRALNVLLPAEKEAG